MAIAQEIKVPLIAVNDTTLTVVELAFEQGAAVKKGDLLLVFETSKTTYDVIAEADGYIGYQCELDADYAVNEIVAAIYSSAAEVPVKSIPKQAGAATAAKEIFTAAQAHWKGDTLFSLAAVQLMQQHQLDEALFAGRDFVSRFDVEQHLGIAAQPVSKAVTRVNTALVPTDADKVIVEKLSSNKKREIEYLSSVQSTGLTSTINTAVDTAGIFVHINPSLQYLKNSLLPVIIYETARLLEKYRELNAYFTGDAVAYYKAVNIGFAIDIDKGLKVLKIPAAGHKTIGETEAAIMELSNKYLDDALAVEDLTDISFTITDLSSEQVSFFRPLINMMNSAILGVSSIDEKMQQCMLSVSFDHRVTEGKKVAQFLQELKTRLESYRSKNVPAVNQDISCFKCFKTLKEDLSDVGFARCITPSGAEAYICQGCLKGF